MALVASPTRAVVLCTTGHLVCALPATAVGETLRPLPIEPLAGAPAAVAGLAIIRGRPLPVLDLARLLGVHPAPVGRFVTVELGGGRRFACAVGSTIGVRRIAGAEFEQLPPLMRSADTAAVAAVGAVDHALLVLLDESRLVPEGTWSALAT